MWLRTIPRNEDAKWSQRASAPSNLRAQRAGLPMPLRLPEGKNLGPGMTLLTHYAITLKQSDYARYDAKSNYHTKCAPWAVLPYNNGPKRIQSFHFIFFQPSIIYRNKLTNFDRILQNV